MAMISDTSIYIIWVCFLYALIAYISDLVIKSQYEEKTNSELASKDTLLLHLYIIILFIIAIQFIINLFGVSVSYIGDIFGDGEVSISFIIFGADEELENNEKLVSIFLCITLMMMFGNFLKNAIGFRNKIQKVKLSFYRGQDGSEESEFNTKFNDDETSTIDDIEQNKSMDIETLEDVVKALDLQLKLAMKESDDLKYELKETKNKVVVLESEVKQKDIQISKIKGSRKDFDKVISEYENRPKIEGGKTLSLKDSVAVGDTIFGGMKIDKQIHNDAEAIAKAVIEAYKQGKQDAD